MKSRFFFNAVLISLAAAFVLPLFSCSDASNDVGSGMVSFYVDKALMQKAVELSDKVSKNPNDEPRGESERRLRFVATLEGEYNETKTVYAPYEGDFGFESFSIDFAAVPVGKTICAKIRIYDEYTQEPVEERPRPIVYGKSQNIRVNSGVNPLAVEACSYRVDVQVKIEIQFDQKPDFSICSDKYIYAVDPMSSFVAKLNNAKDDLRRYEVCNQFMDKYWDDSLGEIALTQENTSFSDDGKTVTVEGEMSLCVSEDDPASRAADARFVLLGQNISYDAGNYSYKTKYYGMTSSTVIPIKARENIAEFSAQKLNVIDTPYALYKKAGAEYPYQFCLASSPSEPATTFDIQTKGARQLTSESYNICDDYSFCFDANGNFYALSSYGVYSTTESYIKSNNEIIGSGGTYECKDGSGNWMLFTAIACDLKKNELYLLQDKYSAGTGHTNILFGTGDFIESGTNAQIAYVLKRDSLGFDTQGVANNAFAVYDGTAYFMIKDLEGKYYFVKAVLSKENTSSASYGRETYDVNLERIHTISLPYSASNDDFVINDMLYQDGNVYLLGCETSKSLYSTGDGSNNTATADVKSRGIVIGVDVSSGAPVYGQRELGWYVETVDKSSTYFYAYNGVGASNPINLYSVAGDSEGNNDAANKVVAKASECSKAGTPLGNLYLHSTADSAFFYGPKKFVAIKPKKLVIADDGIAVYTDELGVLCFKNVDRVITIDLETFSMAEVVDAKVPFVADTTWNLMGCCMYQPGGTPTIYYKASDKSALEGTQFYKYDYTHAWVEYYSDGCLLTYKQN